MKTQNIQHDTPRMDSQFRVPSSPFRVGFTLIELLVVVTIIVVLLTLLLPAAQNAISMSQDTTCRNQQRQVATAFLSFAADRFGRMPGNTWWTWCAPPSDPDGGPYFGKEVDPRNMTGWGHTGTLAPYLGVPAGGTTTIYKCPGIAAGVLGSGVGSNGIFDFDSPIAWAGVNINLIPGSSLVRNPNTNVSSLARTPLVGEEDPAMNINRPLTAEMGYGNTDQMGTWHLNYSTNYAAFDGSVAHLFFGGRGPDTYDWSARTPSGGVSNFNLPYARWNSL